MTRPQRTGLALLLLMWAGALAALLTMRPTTVGSSSERGSRVDEVVVGIDPNAAPLEDLIAVPSLGERRARAIIETRDKLARESPDRPAFQTPADLELVPGIGPVLRESMTPYFRFPGGTGDE
jgi:DNA uptake protein ComE-like DNA-binding protein